jgi:thymidine phosphorylase
MRPVQRAVPAGRTGRIHAIDVRALGLVVVALGGGRRTPADVLDLRVGLDRVLPLGAEVGRGDALAIVHAADEASAERAAAAVSAAVTLGDSAAAPMPPLLRGRVSS